MNHQLLLPGRILYNRCISMLHRGVVPPNHTTNPWLFGKHTTSSAPISRLMSHHHTRTKDYNNMPPQSMMPTSLMPFNSHTNDIETLHAHLIQPFVENIHSLPHTREHLRNLSMTEVTLDQWKMLTNGHVTFNSLSPQVYRKWITHDASLFEPEFKREYSLSSAGMHTALACLPEFDHSLTDQEILNQVVEMGQDKYVGAIGGNFTTLPAWKQFARGLMEFARWSQSKNWDRARMTPPIAFPLYKAVGFSMDRFDFGQLECNLYQQGTTNPETDALELVRATQRVNYTVNLRMTANEMNGMENCNKANPFTVACGIEAKEYDREGGKEEQRRMRKSLLGQLAISSLLLSLRNMRLYNVNHPIPMTLIEGSKVEQFVAFYPSEMLERFCAGGGGDLSHQMPKDLQAFVHRVDYGDSGLDLFRKGDGERICLDLHALAGYLAQPMGSFDGESECMMMREYFGE